MPVVVVLLAIVILGGVLVVASGRGGELARDRGGDDLTPADFRSWSDVAGYRPPPALLGYHAAATERALSMIARTIAERDAEIAWLRSKLAEARAVPAAEQPPDSDRPAAGPVPAPVPAEPVMQGGFSAQQAPAPPGGDEA